MGMYQITGPDDASGTVCVIMVCISRVWSMICDLEYSRGGGIAKIETGLRKKGTLEGRET